MSTKYVVAIYHANRSFGGPEEGGWWFDTGKLVRLVKVFTNENRAIEYARRLNGHLDGLVNKNRRPKWSVISDGVYEAEVYEDVPPTLYPEVRPHYE